MIIEKKSEVVRPDQIVIPANYVLVKPDDHYTEYQVEGRETGILSTNFTYDPQGRRILTKEKNYSVTGTVYGVPKKLRFYCRLADKISDKRNPVMKVNGENVIICRSDLDKLVDYRKASVEFDTEMELKVGDRIRFSYMAHNSIEEKLGYIETTEGKMYLMDYSSIFMTINEDRSPKRCVNGYVLVVPDMKELERDGATEGVESNGIFIVNLGEKRKKDRKRMIGTVVATGSRNNGYKNILVKSDPEGKIEIGDRLFFDARGAMRLEPLLHQEHKEELLLIQRIDIYVCGDSVNQIRF